jgi:large-conductance mechanosensitive channel
MDDSVKASTPHRSDTGNWVGRIIVAVILGEAIWNLIVSVMNNLIVPWLGDVMGQSSGLPTSFTQRPYNYPDLFVAVVEFCIAGLVAAVLNYFLQRRRAGQVTVKRLGSNATVRIAPVSPPVAQAPLTEFPIAQVPITQVPSTQTSPPIAPPPASKPILNVPPSPSTPVAATIAKPVTVLSSVPSAPNSLATPTQPASKPQVAIAPAPKVEPAKPKKPRQVYYNIVGEPVSSDDD